MKNSTSINIRLDKELKKQSELLFSELGLNMTTAIHVFLRQAVRQKKIPFEIGLIEPNKETSLAMREAELISNDDNVKGYTDIDELFEELDS